MLNDAIPASFHLEMTNMILKLPNIQDSIHDPFQQVDCKTFEMKVHMNLLLRRHILESYIQIEKISHGTLSLPIEQELIADYKESLNVLFHHSCPIKTSCIRSCGPSTFVESFSLSQSQTFLKFSQDLNEENRNNLIDFLCWPFFGLGNSISSVFMNLKLDAKDWAVIFRVMSNVLIFSNVLFIF